MTDINEKTKQYLVHDENNIKGFFGQYKYLSNFHVCPVYFEGLLFQSSEAAYMSAKTNNPIIKEQFTKIEHSKDAKKLGRTIELRDDWEEVKLIKMNIAVLGKFLINKDLRELLLSTKDKYLEETNHWKDQFWGVCDGVGENHLGKILMEVREYLKQDDNL